jgi:hypothetical protein
MPRSAAVSIRLANDRLSALAAQEKRLVGLLVHPHGHGLRHMPAPQSAFITNADERGVKVNSRTVASRLGGEFETEGRTFRAGDGQSSQRGLEALKLQGLKPLTSLRPIMLKLKLHPPSQLH